MKLSTLYKKTSTGAIQEWSIEVFDEFSRAKILTVYGQTGGKIQYATEYITEGKNAGKSNETTYLEQANSEAMAQWKLKKRKGYVEDIEDAKSDKVDLSVILGGVSPMLAHKFSEQGHKIKYPCYVQPKLDGHRCIAVIEDGVCTLWSRTRKQIFGVPHIEKQLGDLFPNGLVVLDGELYNHAYKDKFEELTSFIRQTTPKSGHEVVEYWIYDAVLDHEPFKDRTAVLEQVLARTNSVLHRQIVIVGTEEIDEEDDLINWFAHFLALGFEGAMVRNADSLYVNKRSYDLQKIKEFDDAEFEIVNVVPGKGKMSDKGVFICRTEAGDEFKVKMKGELDSLIEVLDNPDRYIGKMLTVKYQGLTNKNGVPRFGVGERLREDI